MVDIVELIRGIDTQAKTPNRWRRNWQRIVEVLERWGGGEFIPYTGAAENVDLGAHSLTVNSVEIVGSDGEVNAAAVEDKFLRNDGNDETTGKLTVGGLTITDAKDVELDTTTGSKIGTSASQKLAFYDTTPIVQPASGDQASVSLGNTDNEIGGLTISDPPTQAEVEALRDKCEELADDVRAVHTLLEAMRTAFVNLGLIKGSA